MITGTSKIFLNLTKLVKNIAIVISMLFFSISGNAQTLGPIPDIDITGVDMNEIYSMVEPEDAKGLLDLLGMFDIEEAEVPSPKLSDFWKRDKKRRKYSVRETAGWLTNFVLSGRLSQYMDKAHSLYIILHDDENKLHEKFFDSYVLISPVIMGSSNVLEFITNAQRILDKIEAIKAMLQSNTDLIADDEMEYFITTLNMVLMMKERHMDDFNNLTTDNVIVATEGQRLQLIDMLNQESSKVDKGLDMLYSQIVTLLMARTKNKITNETLDQLFNLVDTEE